MTYFCSSAWSRSGEGDKVDPTESAHYPHSPVNVTGQTLNDDLLLQISLLMRLGGRAENRWQPQSCQLMAVCTIKSRRSKNYWGFQLETNIVNTAADHFELHQHLEKPTTESERVDAESTAFLFNSEIRQSCRASVFRWPRPMNTLSQYVPSVGTHGRPRRSKRNFT